MEISRLKSMFAAITVFVIAAWWFSLSQDAFSGGFWLTRNTLVYGTGVLSIGFMSVAVILAARPVWFEDALGGLDKFYRLHKWLGVAALLLGVTHWLLRIMPSWIAQTGLMTLPQRPPRVPHPPSTGFDPFRDLHGLASVVGEWTLYLLIALVVLALWKRFPYRYFFMTHRLMAPAYLALVFHSVILMDKSYWTTPIGPLMALLMAAGSVAAVMSLFHRIGYSRRAAGAIKTLTHHEDNNVLDVGVQLSTVWPGHKAGQFAFVDFADVEAAHPFTVSSAWHQDGQLMFSIKGLGDYTRTLAKRLFIGQGVTVEGPYGRFNFHGDRRRQIWVGGGVGIAPFIARLKALAEEGRSDPVDLFYATRAPAAVFIENIRQLAEQTGVRFHLLLEQKDGRLTMDRLATTIPEWKEADMWFCGPQGFGRALRKGMMARGFPPAHFHQELFELR